MELSEVLKFSSPAIPISFDNFSERRIIIMESPLVNHNQVNLVLSNYTKFRDYSNNPPAMAPWVVLSYLIATSWNASLVSPASMLGNADNSIINSTSCKVSKLRFRVTEEEELCEKYFRNCTQEGRKQNDKTSAAIIQMDASWNNFAYCSRPRKELGSLSPLELFQITAGSSVWICLGLCLVLISILIKDKHDYSYKIITTLSVLISPGMSGTLSSNSKLFILWTFVCLLWTTFYSGLLTSVVISPGPEIRLNTISELLEKNRTVIFHEVRRYTILKESVKETLGWRQTKNSSSFHEKIALKRLLEGAVLLQNSSEENFLSKLVSDEKVATVSSRGYAASVAISASQYIKDKNIKHKKCFPGKQPVTPVNTFFLAISQESQKLAGIFQVLMEAGFYDRWIREFHGMATFKRVQDRGKVDFSLSRVMEPDPPKTLELSEGKLKNVFILWGICLSASLCCMVVEKSWYIWTSTRSKDLFYLLRVVFLIINLETF